MYVCIYVAIHVDISSNTGKSQLTIKEEANLNLILIQIYNSTAINSYPLSSTAEKFTVHIKMTINKYAEFC